MYVCTFGYMNVRKRTCKFPRLRFININLRNSLKPKGLPTSFPGQIIPNQLLISRVKPEPRCQAFRLTRRNDGGGVYRRRNWEFWVHGETGRVRKREKTEGMFGGGVIIIEGRLGAKDVGSGKLAWHGNRGYFSRKYLSLVCVFFLLSYAGEIWIF